jgi:GTPase SAR1 family protein
MSTGQTADIRVRCVCLGETGVGKTSLCEAFTAHTAVTSPGRPAGQAATLEVHIDVATINAKVSLTSTCIPSASGSRARVCVWPVGNIGS